VTVYTDYNGRKVRLTDERRAHLLTHPEMVLLEPRLADAIASTEVVVRSGTDETVLLVLPRRIHRAVRRETALRGHQTSARGFVCDHRVLDG